MHEQPGLFDVPTPEVAAPPRTGRGRARETYARTVVADVVVQDAAALRAAALRALDGGIVIAEWPGPPDDEVLDPCDEVATSSAAALEWCLEPTTGLWPLLEDGVVQVVAVDLAVDEVAAARVRAHWTVTIKIRDAQSVRELALAACPATDVDSRTEIERNFVAAWHRAADPYVPMTGIPGVAWTPVEVTVVSWPARGELSQGGGAGNRSSRSLGGGVGRTVRFVSTAVKQQLRCLTRGVGASAGYGASASRNRSVTGVRVGRRPVPRHRLRILSIHRRGRTP